MCIRDRLPQENVHCQRPQGYRPPSCTRPRPSDPLKPVSYTHLDVYKRQALALLRGQILVEVADLYAARALFAFALFCAHRVEVIKLSLIHICQCKRGRGARPLVLSLGGLRGILSFEKESIPLSPSAALPAAPVPQLRCV